MNKKLWNKNFILLLQSSAVSTIGDLMYGVAIGYWVYEQTGSSALMGIMSAISMFVTMLLSPFSGSIVDKCNRKWVLVVGDIFQGVLMIAVGILAFAEKLNVPIVLVAAFLASLGGVFYSPAASTALVDIIPRDDMVRGQSLFSGTNSVINMVGSAFSGVLVVFLGVPLIIVINGLSNLYAALSEMFVSIPKTVQQGEPVSVKGILRDTKVAIKEIFTHPQLQLFIPCLLIINMLGSGPFTLILPFTAEKGFTVEQYGYLMAVWTSASLIAVVVLGAIKFGPKARFWIMSISFCASCVFFILAFWMNNFVWTCVFAFVAGLANAGGNAIFNASLMLALPEENRGAIMGFISSASVGGSALSAIIYGLLGEVFPLYIVFIVGNALCIVPMCILCFHKKTKDFILAN
ncbi:MAG: MFS transporter [Clostridia bacterium]|nr:MFS transporter [Clostridia bacterium]